MFIDSNTVNQIGQKIGTTRNEKEERQMSRIGGRIGSSALLNVCPFRFYLPTPSQVDQHWSAESFDLGVIFTRKQRSDCLLENSIFWSFSGNFAA